MPATTPAPAPDLDALVAHYRDLLGLRDWEIRAEWADDLDGALACVVPTPTRRLATIRISRACPAEELRASIAHELVHVLLSPLSAVTEPSGGALMLEEQAVEALALAVVRAESTPTDRTALSRAVARLPAALRARIDARSSPAPRARGGDMLTPAQSKAALEAISKKDAKGALAVLTEIVMAMIGGAEEASSEPSSDAIPAAQMADAAAPPTEEEAERKRAGAKGLPERLRALVGGASDEEVEGRVRAALQDAAAAKDLRPRLAQLEAAEKARAKADADAALRDKLARAVRAGKYARAEVFDAAEKDGAETLTPKAWTREMPPAALDAMIAAKQAREDLGAPLVRPEESPLRVPAMVREYARARGIADEKTIARLARELAPRGEEAA